MMVMGGDGDDGDGGEGDDGDGGEGDDDDGGGGGDGKVIVSTATQLVPCSWHYVCITTDVHSQ